MADNNAEQFAYHRPISMTIRRVSPMPILRELPQQTLMTFNLRGDKATGDLLIAEITRQLENGSDSFAVTIEGIS